MFEFSDFDKLRKKSLFNQKSLCMGIDLPYVTKGLNLAKPKFFCYLLLMCYQEKLLPKVCFTLFIPLIVSSFKVFTCFASNVGVHILRYLYFAINRDWNPSGSASQTMRCIGVKTCTEIHFHCHIYITCFYCIVHVYIIYICLLM